MSKTTTTSRSNEWGRFESADQSERYNIIGSSQGVGGSGKTHFWLTAPEPIAVFLFDPAGLKGLTGRSEFRDKDIRVINYYEKINLGSIREKEERARVSLEALHDFRADWVVALKKARTIVWDKEDHIWEMMRYATHEDYSAEPKTFYELNMEYRGMFADAEAAGVNFGVVRGMREKWGKTGVSRASGKPTYGGLGELIPRGQKEVEELVQINLDHQWNEEQRAFVVKILDKCRLGNAVELLGQELANLDFTTLAMLLYPDAPSDVWI